MNEPLIVNADAAKLKQVLINIIGNATKFTEEGSITISKEIQVIDGKSYVVIKVQDTGVGIDPAHQQQLFRPFVMVEGANSRKFGGTGLGLAISKNLIELMNGTITLESAGINQGTTISVSLPLIDIANQPDPEEQENSDACEVSSDYLDETIKENNQVKKLEESTPLEKGEDIPTPTFTSYQKKPQSANRLGISDSVTLETSAKTSSSNLNR
jgi:hypothetical protein